MKIKAKNMKIYFQKLNPSAKLPAYAYEGDDGMDLFSCEDLEIAPHSKALISTGLRVAVPKGHGGFVWDKSGIAVKNHIKTMAGVIDSNYRGELKVALTNLGSESYKIKKGGTVSWINASSKSGTVNSASHPNHNLHRFLNLGEFPSGSSFEAIFEKEGTYSYHNHLNPQQQGTVVVK